MKKETKKLVNPWIKHLMEVKKQNPNKSYKDCMGLAKKTYKKK